MALSIGVTTAISQRGRTASETPETYFPDTTASGKCPRARSQQETLPQSGRYTEAMLDFSLFLIPD
jgi:hypothetical protein